MTPEEIKKIAEECACKLYPASDAFSRKCIANDLSDVIALLTERFYLVEKDRVIAKYNEVKKLNTICDDMFADDTAVFEYLFGTSMFKQNEE